jgi:hypothetical protein
MKKAKKKVSRKRGRHKLHLPALSTLVKTTTKSLETGLHKLQTALEVKLNPGLFTKTGRRSSRSGPVRASR